MGQINCVWGTINNTAATQIVVGATVCFSQMSTHVMPRTSVLPNATDTQLPVGIK